MGIKTKLKKLSTYIPWTRWSCQKALLGPCGSQTRNTENSKSLRKTFFTMKNYLVIIRTIGGFFDRRPFFSVPHLEINMLTISFLYAVATRDISKCWKQHFSQYLSNGDLDTDDGVHVEASELPGLYHSDADLVVLRLEGVVPGAPRLRPAGTQVHKGWIKAYLSSNIDDYLM